jgi:hypothetical protein
MSCFACICGRMMRKLSTEDGEDGDTPVLWNVVVDALKKSGDSQVTK